MWGPHWDYSGVSHRCSIELSCLKDGIMLLWLIVMFLELFLSSFVAWLDAAIREAVGRQKCLQKRSQKKSTCMDVNRKINLSTT